MKAFFVTAVFLVSALFLSEAKAQPQFAYRVSFTDKIGSSGDLAHPEDFLSARALARRTRLSINIDNSDLPVSRVYTDSVLKITSGTFHCTSRWLNQFVVLLTDSAKMADVRTKTFVTKVELVARFGAPLHALTAGTSSLPEGPASVIFSRLAKTTGSVAYYGDAFEQINMANGDLLHDKGLRGKGMLIAVLDAGFRGLKSIGGFDSLRSSGRIIDSFNIDFNSKDIDGYSDHGTQVLSTLAGVIPGQYVGTAPDADYALYVTEDNGSEQPFELDNLVAGLERADSVGADVATISLGYNFMSIGSKDASLSLSDIDGKSTVAAKGANMAVSRGMLVIASAGNDGDAAGWGKILTPGDADSVLTCGSVDKFKNVVSSSGKGPNAAGVRKPDVCMMGAPGIVLTGSGTPGAVGGTSIAAPQLAGLAACLWASNPKATPATLRQVIRECAHLAATPDNVAGWGVPDFGKASLSFDSVPPLDQFKIGPNPFSSSLTIWTGARATVELQWRIVDLQGRTLLSGAQKAQSGGLLYEIKPDVDLPDGTYFLQLYNGELSKTLMVFKSGSAH